MPDIELVFREEGPAIWRALYAFTGGRRGTADDAMAEAFARAIASREEIRDPAAWIYRVSFRLAARELRGTPRFDEEARVAPTAPAESPDLLPALRRLSPNQRAAIVLVFEEGLSVAETAKRLGIAPATVRVHIHRGRKRLRELLGQEEA